MELGRSHAKKTMGNVGKQSLWWNHRLDVVVESAYYNHGKYFSYRRPEALGKEWREVKALPVNRLWMLYAPLKGVMRSCHYQSAIHCCLMQKVETKFKFMGTLMSSGNVGSF